MCPSRPPHSFARTHATHARYTQMATVVTPGSSRVAASYTSRGGWCRRFSSSHTTTTTGGVERTLLANHHRRRGGGGKGKGQRGASVTTTASAAAAAGSRGGGGRAAGHRMSAIATGSEVTQEKEVVRERLAQYTFHTVAGRQVTTFSFSHPPTNQPHRNNNKTRCRCYFDISSSGPNTHTHPSLLSLSLSLFHLCVCELRHHPVLSPIFLHDETMDPIPRP